MAGDNWYNTRGGRDFADITVPRLIKAIEELSEIAVRLEEKTAHLEEKVDVLTEQLNAQRPDTEYALPENAFERDVLSAYAEITGRNDSAEARYRIGSRRECIANLRYDFGGDIRSNLGYDELNDRLTVNGELYTPGAITRDEMRWYMTCGDNGDALIEALEQMQRYGTMNDEQCKAYLLNAVMEHLEDVSVPGAEDFANRGTYHGGIAMHIMDAAADYIHRETGREVLWEDNSIFVKESQREKQVPER